MLLSPPVLKSPLLEVEASGVPELESATGSPESEDDSELVPTGAPELSLAAVVVSSSASDPPPLHANPSISDHASERPRDHGIVVISPSVISRSAARKTAVMDARGALLLMWNA
jgi:hypothetical protein